MDIILKKQQGFTLIELVMVIIIISILSVMVVFSWPGTTINLANQAQQVTNDIRYTQSLAMTKGQRYRWVKTASNAYQIQDNSGTPIKLSQGNTLVTFGAGITFGTFTNLPNNLINFDSKGTPYSDTTLPGTALSSSAVIAITAGSTTRTVTISPETGGVTLQ
jgi:prepilin-type N-terminal cleavage/methylation domain-containing protein